MVSLYNTLRHGELESVRQQLADADLSPDEVRACLLNLVERQQLADRQLLALDARTRELLALIPE